MSLLRQGLAQLLFRFSQKSSQKTFPLDYGNKKSSFRVFLVMPDVLHVVVFHGALLPIPRACLYLIPEKQFLRIQ